MVVVMWNVFPTVSEPRFVSTSANITSGSTVVTAAPSSSSGKSTWSTTVLLTTVAARIKRSQVLILIVSQCGHIMLL